MQGAICHLPGAYWDANGQAQREVELRPLSGAEEELLADQGPVSAALVSRVLSRCIVRLGHIRPVSEDIARQLLVADREYLLLKLRQLSFGDQVQASVSCPWPDCGARADIDFSINGVPVKESTDKGPLYRLTLSTAAAQESGVREVCIRLPNGEDQEILSPLLAENEARALTCLLARCVQSMDGRETHNNETIISQLSPRARREIEQHMEAVAPGVDLTLQAQCPECGRAYPVPFELQEFFFGELRVSHELLYREVHYLAYHYHWSEAEILNLTRDKRRRYIDVLADEIERLNYANGQ